MGRYAAMSLLLVEPSRAQAHITSARLAELGLTVVNHVRTGSLALEALAGGAAPDLLLSAMYLEDMTGTELVQAIRANPETEELMFALLSSEKAPRFLEPLRQCGVIGILEKPLSAKEMVRVLDSVLEVASNQDLGISGYLDDIRVLLVDDSRTARRFMRRVLESIGLERFDEATNGREALSLIERQTFDLLVTDLHMPEMNGIELTRYIRQSGLQPGLPIMMVTSEQQEQTRGEALQSGIDALCEKPFEPNLIRGILEQLLEA